MKTTGSTDPLLGSRVHIAVKAAVAAAVAWQVGNLVPPPVGDYAYYAPLGAVLAVHPSVAASLRDSAHLFTALVMGASVGAGFHLLPVPGWAAIGLLVLVAVLLGGWDRLGDQRSWVITAALFTYILGNIDTSDFVSGLVGQVAIGAAIGFTLMLLLPPVPVRVSVKRLENVADLVADQLDALADALVTTRDDEGAPWHDLPHEVQPEALRLRESYAALDDALRGNLRAGRWRAVVAQQRRTADVIERVADLAENLTFMISEVQQSDGPWLRPGGDAARTVADTLHDLAAVVRTLARDQQVAAADAATVTRSVERVSALVAQSLDRGEEAFPGAAVVVSLRRILGALPVTEGAEPPPGIRPLSAPAWPPGRRRRSPGR
ncbi:MULTISPECIES: hypothetical protein [Mumia]|uniref:hypothetical protein n=1 Tax=Mumia TaxID=1546255 RepID=UPI001422B6CB|nr:MULTISPECIES: hypothetical protein [unclassified Mumia]QMW64702.1 hypothetical protein H4N58_10540 [Mumia sp. ZJ1417]